MAILGLLPRSRLAVAQAHILPGDAQHRLLYSNREEITFCRDFRALVPERPAALPHGATGSRSLWGDLWQKCHVTLLR